MRITYIIHSHSKYYHEIRISNQIQIKSNLKRNLSILKEIRLIRNHLFSTSAKLTCAYQEVKHFSFLEIFAWELNGWSQIIELTEKLISFMQFVVCFSCYFYFLFFFIFYFFSIFKISFKDFGNSKSAQN